MSRKTKWGGAPEAPEQPITEPSPQQEQAPETDVPQAEVPKQPRRRETARSERQAPPEPAAEPVVEETPGEEESTGEQLVPEEAVAEQSASEEKTVSQRRAGGSSKEAARAEEEQEQRPEWEGAPKAPSPASPNVVLRSGGKDARPYVLEDPSSARDAGNGAGHRSAEWFIGNSAAYTQEGEPRDASSDFLRHHRGLGGTLAALGGAISRKLFGEGKTDGPASREEEREASPEELEERLKLSLRETAVGGFSRICVGSPKGGVGKSSIAYAMACSISYFTNLRVALVDADPNFGSTRMLVPRPVDYSVVELASHGEGLQRLSDLRQYVAQHELMRLDVLTGPAEAARMAELEDLGEAYASIDCILSRFYDVVIYDLGLGFRDPAIRRVLSLSDELLFVSDGEVIPNAQLTDAIRYLENLGVDLGRTTLALNHRLPRADESADSSRVRAEHSSSLRRITEIPYDARLSQLLNRREFHIQELSTDTRLGILTTAAAAVEGLRRKEGAGEPGKVVSHSGGDEHIERKGA